MSKLPKENKFLDLSDYGRPVAKLIARQLKNTNLTAIHVTIGFIISGFIAIFCIYKGLYWVAAIFLILKSILDAADGELARIKNTPSYVGRYFDSVADIILNFIILLVIWNVSEFSFFLMVAAFIGMQLQGTLYNYYYVILRNRYNGDTTSRVFEDKTPTALPGESQSNVDLFFLLYKIFYGLLDKTILILDKSAVNHKEFPKWFMSTISIFGLGFQLLVISVMLVLEWKDYIIPYFIVTTGLIFAFIGIRKLLYIHYK